MKKYLMTLGLMLGMLSLTSCQKDAVDNSLEIENGGKITHTFTMGGEWNKRTRSYYEEGEGVKLTGQEAITVYYGDAQYAANDETANSKLKTTKGTPEGNFAYSFSHDAISGAEAYDYYFVMPNTTTNNVQSKGHRVLVYLNTIQTPSATTFDPAQDYLLGRPILNQSSALTDATVYFKRIFAPLRMTIKNDGLLEAGEKILYTTISQSTPCTQKTGLTGNAYIMFSDGDNSATKSDAYEHAVIRNFSSTGVGNKVTAFYPNGLEADASGNFPIWFIINPENYSTGDPTSISGDMTVTIVTDKRMVSRTVTLENPMNFASDKLNKFSITFAENADIVSGEAVTTVFANVASLDELTGWSFENCSINKNALEVAKDANGRINIPARAGYSVKKIVVLPSLYHPNNSTANTVSLYSGDEKVGETYEFNAQKMLTDNSNMYGYLVVDVPATAQSNIALVRESTSVISSIRAITVIYEKSDSPQAAVELTNADKTALTFNVALTNANKYYYLLQATADAAPTADDVVANGEEGTNAELTISGLNEDTAYTLYLVPAQDSKNGSLVSVDAKTMSSAIDYYTEYTSGKDITVNGITFKAGDYTAVLGDATTADFNYHNTLNEKEEKIIIFMDTEGNYVGTNGSNTNIQGDIVIMSRYSNKKANIKPGKYLKLSAQTEGAASLTLLNLNIDFPAASGGSYLFSNSGAAADTEALIFKGCSINIEKQRFYQAHNSHLNYIIKNIIFENNVYRTTYDNSAKNYMFDFKATPRMGAIETIKLVNNIFYNSNNLTAAWNITAYGNGSETFDDYVLEITCKNNTFIDLVGRDMYFKVYRMKSFNVNDNIFYGTQTSGTYDDKNSLLYRTYGTGHEVIPFSVTGNVYYGYVNWNHYTSDSTFVIGGKNTQVKLDASPFTTLDPANGVFVVSSAYANLGYQAEYTY